MIQLNEDPKRQAILNSDGHLLVMGGPGSGKTTIALLKANRIIESSTLKNGQKVLFLKLCQGNHFKSRRAD